MGDSNIEWTDKTWNPVRGCTRVSDGCRNCYAEKVAMRFSGSGMPYEGLVKIINGHPQWTGKIHLAEDKLEEPLHWKKPSRVFVNSMSDLFHEDVPFEFIDKVRATTCMTMHTYQVLTKRPQRMLAYQKWTEAHTHMNPGWPSNVWLGVSVEDQKTADERIPLLLQTPAAVRWVSYEPALKAVDFFDYMICNCDDIPCTCIVPGIDWIVCGGESGPGARPFDIQWARSVRDQCRAAGVPFFMKQLGSNVIQDGEHRVKKDKKGGDMHEWPHDLRVREYPTTT